MTDDYTPGPLPLPDGWALTCTYYPEKTTHLGGLRFAGAERYATAQMHAYARTEVERELKKEREKWTEAVMSVLDSNGQAHSIVNYVLKDN